MVAYSFKARFAEPILDGTKLGTIRAPRKRHARRGEELQLYTGMRTKHCRLIARKPCHAALPITLELNGEGVVSVAAGDQTLQIRDLDAFARADGFASFGELQRFWLDEHETSYFRGVWILWSPPSALIERRLFAPEESPGRAP
jgi:hypothetical protein